MKPRRRFSPRVGVFAALPVVGLAAIGAYAYTGDHSGKTTAAAVPPPAPVSTPAASTTAASNAFADLSPAAILAGARTAMLQAGSVRVSTVGDQTAARHDKTTVDGMRSEGIQTETADGYSMTVMVFPEVTYLKANVLALTKTLGLTAALAKQTAGQWIQFTSDDPGYAEISSGITVPSIADAISPHGAMTKLPVTMKQGQLAVGVTGAAASDFPSGTKETSWFAVSGAALPVETDFVVPNDGFEQFGFSHWGTDQPMIDVPSHALTLIHSATPTSPATS